MIYIIIHDLSFFPFQKEVFATKQLRNAQVFSDQLQLCQLLKLLLLIAAGQQHLAMIWKPQEKPSKHVQKTSSSM